MKNYKYPLVVVFNTSKDAYLNQEENQMAFIYSETGLNSLKGDYTLYEEVA